MPFLPVSKEDMEKRGLKELDFVYVCGDAYVDHPSFGHAIICRVLEAHGYSVGIIAQPDWKDEGSITVLGRPRLGFFVSAGNMDSMVNHYTVNKKKRSQDAYSPGGKTGRRPDRAVIVYGNLIRRKFKDVPVIILTANSADDAQTFYISKGFTDYLAKPVNGEKLEERAE